MDAIWNETQATLINDFDDRLAPSPPKPVGCIRHWFRALTKSLRLSILWRVDIYCACVITLSRLTCSCVQNEVV